jgi:hypothetical protein
VDERDSCQVSIDQVSGQERRLVLKAADLVVEPGMAPRLFATAVVQRGKPGSISHGPHHDSIVADGRAQDGQHTAIVQPIERGAN